MTVKATYIDSWASSSLQIAASWAILLGTPVLEQSPGGRGTETECYYQSFCCWRPEKHLYLLRAHLTGLLGAELILRRSSWIFLASFMREGCRVKLRLVAVDEKRFLAQFSTEAQGWNTLFFLPSAMDSETGDKHNVQEVTFQEKLFFVNVKPSDDLTSRTLNLRKLFRADPFKGWFPPPLFCHVNFFDELQASQHIRYIVQSPHFCCKHIIIRFCIVWPYVTLKVTNQTF